MEARISRLEEDMREVKATGARLEAAAIRIETMLSATLPHLATKAELAARPTCGAFSQYCSPRTAWGSPASPS